MTNAAIIVAAGRGTRVAGAQVPKQYQELGGISLLRHTLDAFLAHDAIDRVVTVIHPDDAGRYAAIASQHRKLMKPVHGGASRQQSVLNGLAALEDLNPDKVLIQDAARPFASAALLTRVIGALDAADAVLPVVPVANTLKRIRADGTVAETVPRENLAGAETPQGFRFAAIRDAHRRAAAAGVEVTDDAAVAEWAGIPVVTVAGEAGNVKLTTAEDFADADRRLAAEAALAAGDVRVGVGYDVHALGPGDWVTLGGVQIPHTRGLVGHSDADVVLHALTDAVLGALADGDIGSHFPPSDERWRGASSDRFLAFAVERVAARGGRLAHLDVAVIAEAPKIGPHRDAMRTRIASIAGIRPDQVGVKATTNEGLGFIGRSEGIAAYAMATIRLPFRP
ncbi:MAG: bifunctional 2-C-methyl-D-erythritol 4-phosphate cytidylyltransferase/2-C-methyl-D-erythritol 2,4-cyclodiphosphate synthase [Rhizobiales bacterium]|nr:bifunctional 2-C-methyl-D-erythritol 4-phosphate cytidylyltransferase/2-C-methyl-D-erythritol 2,4-cyclodiphosphate synthase [Hyphomicrobiales bacterium]